MRYLSAIGKLLVLICIYIFAQQAVTAQGQFIELSPGYHNIVFEQTEKENKVITTTLKNSTYNTLNFQMRLLDIDQASASGKLKLINSSKQSTYSLAPYLKLPTQLVQIKSGQTSKIAVELDPKTMPDGSYFGAILFSTVDNTKTTNKKQESTTQAGLVSYIFITKKGNTISSIELKNFNLSQQYIYLLFPNQISFELINRGKTIVIPYGRVIIKDMFGRIVTSESINIDSKLLLPGNQQTFTTQLKKMHYLLPFAVYEYAYIGNDREKSIFFNVNGKFLYINPVIIFIFLLILAFIYKMKIITHLKNKLRSTKIKLKKRKNS